MYYLLTKYAFRTEIYRGPGVQTELASSSLDDPGIREDLPRRDDLQQDLPRSTKLKRFLKHGFQVVDKLPSLSIVGRSSM